MSDRSWPWWRPGVSWCAAGLVVALAIFLLPSLALAQSEELPVTEPCSSCHSDETHAWGQSPHANIDPSASAGVGASCIDCHGEYDRGHPDTAVSPLAVDSSMCQDCHAGTFDQWQHSIHAENGVQCIGCHVSHSQSLRLTDEELCASCHRDALGDSLHQAHWEAACTNCHMPESQVTGAVASRGDLALGVVPDHDFVSVSARNCLNCHSDDVKAEANASTAATLRTALHEESARVSNLASELRGVEHTNRSLLTLSVANLGFGIGIGGIMGIAFMLVVAYFGIGRGGKS